MHGMSLPDSLLESQKLPKPVFTPSTKAEAGQHDENIHPNEGIPPPLPWHPPARLLLPAAEKLVGKAIYDRISSAALDLYSKAAEYAVTKGVIIADTKFEFGLIPSTDPNSPFVFEGQQKEVILIDEVLTPDSSRFWPAEDYAEGKPQASFDKQYLRDWLVKSGFSKGLEAGLEGKGWTIDPDIVEGTKMRYEEALERLTGSNPAKITQAFV